MDTHFFAGLTKFKLDAGKFRRDDDFSDRFSHTFTTLLLVIFTLVISARQYIGKPIACWVPTEFTRAQEEYAESVCWVTSTYFIPTKEVSVPVKLSDREDRKIHYYQWVPFILMIQAFLFNLPCIIWRLFNWQSGIHLSSIMEVACEIEMIKDPETRKSNVTYVARHIEDALTTQREYRSGCGVKCRHFLARSCCLWFGKRYGNYLICLYLITKSLYILNVVGQFFFMNRILGTNYTFYGIDLLRDLAEGIVWQESGNFPRITLCDFEVRKLANVHRHTVQCVLPINMFNEKIFIFLWFWFILVAAVNTSSFLYWSYKSSFHGNRVHFIRKFLKLRDALEPGDKKRTYAFVDSYLRQDGVFILRLVALNAGELVASEVVEKLWALYKSRQTVNTSRLGPSSLTPDIGKSGALSPRSFLPHQHRSNHQHHSHHRHFPSPTPSGNQQSSRSSLPSSPNEELTSRSHPPPPLYSSQFGRQKMLTPIGFGSPPPPPLPPSSRTTAPPPLPPPPGGSDGRRSSSSNSRSHSSTVGDSDKHSVRLRSTYTPSRPSTSRTVEEVKSSDIGRTDAPKSGSTNAAFSTSKPELPRIHQNEDDPGEFV
uniref:Innexin n=1 Tax=Cryptocotyle lingua TaxID=66766 RepID=A0A7U0TIA6_9TREM|nr:innexin 8 [Cryptocotyle lingua]